MKYKKLPLTEVFDPKRGEAKYTKAFGSKNSGEFPVYSAAIEPLTYINTYDYDGTYLTWNTNGFGGYISILTGKFSINGDRGILIPLREDVDLYYVAHTLQGDLRKLAKGRIGDNGKNEFTKVSLDTIKKALVAFPVGSDEAKFDIEVQQKIAKDFRKINELKNYIASQSKELQTSKFDIAIPGEVITVNVDDLFDLTQSTNSSNFTKKYVNQHPGDIPVFSASNNEDLVGYGYVADNLPGIRYFEDTLTWNIDGSVGRAIYRTGRFSLSEKVIPLVLNEAWKDLVDLEYVKFILEERAAERGFGYSNKAGKSRISDIEIPIPVNSGEDKTPNLETQRNVADSFRRAYELKDEVVEEFNKLAHREISFSASN
ncbi:hypothetical protein EYC58_01885 [Candidatus Saccharibacteria bacterium]|nr:MAG: hypothetical protein EYC58_01885 [Candidatus Saccharibacteria bacterium]